MPLSITLLLSGLLLALGGFTRSLLGSSPEAGSLFGLGIAGIVIMVLGLIGAFLSISDLRYAQAMRRLRKQQKLARSQSDTDTN